MKILVVQDRLRSGGTERQSVLLSRAFADAGHATTLLTFRPGGQLDGTVASHVARVVLQPFDTRLDWFAPGLAGAVERLSPDVILCMGRMANCYGFVLHNVIVDRRPHAAVIGTMRTGKKLPHLFRRSLHAVRQVVANSRDARDHLVRAYGIPAEKIAVIYNSLVFPEGNPAMASTTAPFAPVLDGSASRRLSLRDSVRGASGAADSTLVLLCVAMFRPEKNQRELIEIAAGLPPDLDWQLWLAGDGPARAACEQLVAAKNLSARVKFPGFIRDPAPLYAAADVAVHASSSESLSNFLIEAQAHGLPVVACAAQGIGECFVPDATGWVIPRGQHDAFRARLARLAGEASAGRTARAAAARAFARTTFDPARQVAAYLELFQQLIRTPGP